jgi:polysaccharide biosynthesis/export protein
MQLLIVRSRFRTVAALAAGISLFALAPVWGQAEVGKNQAGKNQAAPPQGAPLEQRSYRIGAGDVLEINVWKEPEASVQNAVVRSDGMISLPLIKEVKAAGQTPIALQEEISQKLAKLIRDADVTVLVKEMRSEKVYVIGAVKKEGPVVIQSRMTVLEAIAEAGGLTDYAKRGKIYILRQDGQEQTRVPFDYSAVIRGKNVEQNVLLQRGDTIVVP